MGPISLFVPIIVVKNKIKESISNCFQWNIISLEVQYLRKVTSKNAAVYGQYNRRNEL